MISWAARDPRAAARSCVLILLVCAAVLCAFNVIRDSGSSPIAEPATWVGVGVELGLVLLCGRVRPEALDRPGLLVAVGIGGVAFICSLDLVTDDPSAAAQAFLGLPVLWASVHFGSAAWRCSPRSPSPATRPPSSRWCRSSRRSPTRSSPAPWGLANHRSFDEALGSVVRRSSPGGTAVVLIDIDRFTSVNDAYGHPVGDAALAHVAAVLRQRVRSGDAVPARLGGDELAVLLPGCSAGTAAARAQDLLDAVTARPLRLADGTLVSLSLSTGVAHRSTAAGTEDLYSAADGALYRAKRGGRGRVATVTA